VPPDIIFQHRCDDQKKYRPKISKDHPHRWQAGSGKAKALPWKAINDFAIAVSGGKKKRFGRASKVESYLDSFVAWAMAILLSLDRHETTSAERQPQ
jgi:hypothetical protein